jgi:hypothetical protein
MSGRRREKIRKLSMSCVRHEDPLAQDPIVSERAKVGRGSLRRIDEGPAVARGHPSSVR